MLASTRNQFSSGTDTDPASSRTLQNVFVPIILLVSIKWHEACANKPYSEGKSKRFSRIAGQCGDVISSLHAVLSGQAICHLVDGVAPLAHCPFLSAIALLIDR